ncbi:MASE1 domain-containing protein [Dyella jejuensis]|uniref:MASE1 domain-containing protein n=1 Tax=Dyella jejuensis TaxID=1432009 RepID=A0ABW8JK62_9GAMM
MGKGSRGNEWLKQVAIAVVYALTYLAIRPYSDAHWPVTSGLRMACLLLVPYRYWPALVMGEIGPLTYTVFQCADPFGLTWAIICSIPPVATGMPIVWYCRRHMKLFPAQRVIDLKVLLICTLVTSLAWALITYGATLTAKVPTDSPVQVTPLMLVDFFVGNYGAALTVITWPLFVRIDNNGLPWKERVRNALSTTLCLDTLLALIPSLALMTWMSHRSTGETAQILQMSMFLPVAWLTFKYGWRGAATGGPLAVLCICLLTRREVPEPGAIQTQALIAIAITCLLVLGTRITTQLYNERRERHVVKNALQVAQHCLQISEKRLRQTSQALELVGGSLAITHSRMVQRVRHLLPPDEGQSLTRQATTTRNQLFRLAESLHPAAWRERGLPAALRETIGRALDEAGMFYSCRIEGRRLSQLAPSVHQIIYRLACEAVAHISLDKHNYQQVHLMLRGGETKGLRWAVLRIEGKYSAESGHPIPHHERQNLSAKLGISSVDLEALRALVALFDGVVHVTQTARSIRVTMLLHDAQHLGSEAAIETHPTQLWVR